MKNIWILAEERPKPKVIEKILCDIMKYKHTKHKEIILDPVIVNNKFYFIYVVDGIEIEGYNKIFIKIVKGESSFVDYMVFEKKDEPNNDDRPIILIEETKTDDSESRNVHAFQRNSKFVYGDMCYPEIKKVMLYTDELIHTQSHPTTTNIFGTNLLLTLGVDIHGKIIDNTIYKKFDTIDELIELKAAMPEPVNGQPIKIKRENGNIYISAKLDKRKRFDKK